MRPWPAPPDEGAAIQVADGVLWASLPLPASMKGLGGVNVYALDDGDGWTLIDTGLDWEDGRAALRALLDGPLAAKPVHRVILTHHHPDHCGLGGWLARRGAEIWASRTAWLTARMLTLDVQEVPSPEQVTFRRRAGVTGSALVAYASRRPLNFADCVAPLPLGFRALQDGALVAAGGRSWTVRLGEGHAPGHVTLWSDDGLLIAGDQVLAGISPNIAVQPTEPDADPLAGWLATCRRFAALGADPLVLPGHRLAFRGLDARLDMLIGNHLGALARIEAALAHEPRTAVDLFDVLYRRPVKEGEFGLALGESVAHLNHLRHAGRVSRSLDRDGAWRYCPTDRPQQEETPWVR